MDDLLLIPLIALLPLMAGVLMLQVNPYHALVLRGLLGAIAALIYALLGAADVALTEALVGTMLSITLYAIAVRSSLCMKLGVIEHTLDSENLPSQHQELIKQVRRILNKYHLRLELHPYPDQATLEAALNNKEVHTIYKDDLFQTRINRLYDFLHQPLAPQNIVVELISTPLPSTAASTKT